MRRFAVLVATVAALSLWGVVGQASAQSPPTQRMITVNGTASRSISASASDAEQQAAYRAALGDALIAAKGKADLIASKQGLVLGPLQTVTEQTDSYPGYCSYPAGSTNSKPGVAAPPGPGGHPVANAPAKHRRHRSHKRHARGANVPPPGCVIGAAVTVTYLVS